MGGDLPLVLPYVRHFMASFLPSWSLELNSGPQAQWRMTLFVSHLSGPQCCFDKQLSNAIFPEVKNRNRKELEEVGQ